MSSLDQVSQSIGKLQGKVEGLEKTQTAIFEKLEVMHEEQTKQRVKMEGVSVKLSLGTAIVTCGVFEGIRLWIKANSGH